MKLTSTLTTARAASERLAREIQDRDLAGLMPAEIRDHTRMQQLIEQACGTILDPRAPDELVCGCAQDLVQLLLSFSKDGILFERPAGKQRVNVLLRKIKIGTALEAAAIELAPLREVLA
jgi:hypothetical protein